MEMIDISLPKKSKEAAVKECEVDQPEFPYGLQLRFEREQVALLPALKTFKVGDKVSISAEATVSMIKLDTRQNAEPQHTIEMQIEKVFCEPLEIKAPEKMSPSEYRQAREGNIIR